MKVCFFSILLFTPLLGAQQRQPAAKPESCSIEGQVTNAQTLEPLRKVEIFLWHVGNAREQRYETTTTAGGRFVVRDIEPGQYRMSANKRGYAGTEYGANGKARSGATLSLDPGQHLENVVLRMPPQAVITGRALDDDGEALPNVEIFLLRYVFEQGKRRLEQWSQATSNDLGEYRMFGLSPGRYYLGATPQDRSGQQRYDSGQGYASVYYPGTTDPAGAKLIELQPGTLLRGIDIPMVKTRTVRVRGRVIDPNSKQNIQGVGVSLERRDESRYAFWANFYSGVDAQGNFEIKGVVPGAYFIQADKRGDNKPSRVQQPIDVRESDIENMVLELSPAAELKGHLHVEGRSVPDLTETQIWLEEDLGTGGATGRIRPDGSFTISELQSGRYQLNIYRFSDDHYLKSARFGDQDVLETGLDLTHGISGSLEVVFSSNGGFVEGVVLNVHDQPEHGATVVLVPDEPRRGQSRRYKEVTTDQYGRFTIKAIPPGGYQLFAWEEIEDGAYQNPDFLKTFEALGEPRTIREGSRESAQLKLIPAEGKKSAPN